ncbi:unnamed protein product [Effrenium voratum]|nr:unnamed protein product [Effrenium voratum]
MWALPTARGNLEERSSRLKAELMRQKEKAPGKETSEAPTKEKKDLGLEDIHAIPDDLLFAELAGRIEKMCLTREEDGGERKKYQIFGPVLPADYNWDALAEKFGDFRRLRASPWLTPSGA